MSKQQKPMRDPLPQVMRPAPVRNKALDAGSAQSLAPPVRQQMERALGQDFSDVRVHTDASAAALTRSLGAAAVTQDNHIAFAPERYRPESGEGRKLLAHELAHVVQQRNGGGGDGANVESNARTVAQTVSSGGQVPARSVGGAEPGGLYCDPDDEVGKPEEAPLIPYRQRTPRQPYLQPPVLDPPQIDWSSMRAPFESRGVPFTMRDADDISAEWRRGAQLLNTFGIDERFKLWFITQDWILNQGISYQLDYLNSRDNPNGIDRLNQQWSAAHPDEFKTPIIPIFSTDWLRKSPAKK